MLKNIITYELYESTTRPVVSFDFDGVCHKSVSPGTIHPLTHDVEKMIPFEKMHERLREEAQHNKVIIVSARNDADTIWKYVKKYDLPVEAVVATFNRPKLPFLEMYNVVKHYDDNKELINDMKDSGIQLVLVDPADESEKIYESEIPKEAGTNSVILIKGSNGRLYGNYIKRVLDYEKNMHMAILGDMFYIFKIDGGKLKASEVPSTGIEKFLGLRFTDQTKKIALNSKTDKTPLWWETLKYTNMGMMINKMGNLITELPDVNWK